MSGIELTLAAKLLTPIITDLYKSAWQNIGSAFGKWKASTFPKKLAKKIANLEKVKTVWQLDKEVKLSQFYYPSRLDRIDKHRSEANSLNDIGRGNTVIEGIVGQGKSIFLRFLAVQELSSAGTGRLPIFFELRNILPGKNLRENLYKELENYDIKITDEIFDYLANSGKIVLLLDGFDELHDDLVKGVIYELESFAERYENLQIVISSRPNHDIQKSRHFGVAKISGLTHHDYLPFLRKIGLTIAKSDELVQAIENSPSQINDLITTPLMLTLVVIVYQTEREIPTDLPEFFDKLFQTVFTRHDKSKPGFKRKHYSGLSERELQRLFEAFCFMVMQNKFSRSLTKDQFEHAFDQALKHCPKISCELENFRLDLTQVACLMLDEGLDATTFLHKSILEYYAAAFIKRCPSKAAEKFYTAVAAKHLHWQQVLKFLAQIDAYRFGKMFIIPNHSAFLKEASSLNRSAPNDVLFGFVQRRIGDLQVAFVNNGTGYIANRFFGFNADIDDWYAQEISSCVVAGIMATVPSPLRNLEDLSIPNNSQFAEREKEYIFSWLKVVKEFGKDIFIKNVNSYMEEVNRELKFYEEIVSQEEEKALIFDDPI